MLIHGNTVDEALVVMSKNCVNSTVQLTRVSTGQWYCRVTNSHDVMAFETAATMGGAIKKCYDKLSQSVSWRHNV